MYRHEMASLDIHLGSKKQVDDFCQKLTKEAEELVSKFFPQKMEELQMLLKTSFSCEDMASLKAPLDIPMPDPAKEEANRKKKEEKEAKEGKKDKDSNKEEEDAGPPCGPICINERVESLLQEVKPQIQTLKEKLNTVSMWVQLQIPKIEDGNNFGVAVQEKVFELLTNTRTKIEGFQTQISKETTDSWSMSWTSISTVSSALWFWTSATHMLCCLTSSTRTMTRLRSPEETGKPSSTEAHSQALKQDTTSLV
uniref:Proteasome activator complex subunit 1 n=1 Tax=Seriola lalandi dorsalis TaxID=1841481 RepID=A0A3B4WXH5_SERLL